MAWTLQLFLPVVDLALTQWATKTLLAAGVTIFWLWYDPWLRRAGIWDDFWWQLSSGNGVLWVVLALFALLTYRLWIAFRRYLRFEHPLATAIASQLMIALLTLKLGLDYYSGTMYGGW